MATHTRSSLVVKLCAKCSKAQEQHFDIDGMKDSDGFGPPGLHASVAELRAGSMGGCGCCMIFLTALEQLLPPECMADFITSRGVENGEFWWRPPNRVHPRGIMQYLAKDKNWVFPIQLFKETGNYMNPSISTGNLCDAILAPCHKTPKSTKSEASINQAKLWLQNCLETHQLCTWAGNDPELIPSRLVHITVNESNYSVRLEEPIYPKPYLCLSHCWGQSQNLPFRTTKSNLTANAAEIAWPKLPKTFQDALVFTHLLGFEYLWIDSICIIQDDESDWLREAGKMGAVFGNSVLTLAATSSKDSHAGLHGTCEPLYSGVHLSLPEIGISEPIYARFRLDHNMELYPLLLRAWVYQERLLSRRVLHFANQELIWECNVQMTCQCTIDDSAFIEADPRAIEGRRAKVAHAKYLYRNAGNIMDRWLTIVTEYSRLSLTHQTDRLVALSGIARQIKERQPWNRYLAGIWQYGLQQQMAWWLDGVSVRSGNWHAPSWSWISFSNKVHFAFDWHNPDEPFISPRTRLVDAHCTSPDGDETVSIDAGAYIDLAGHYLTGVLQTAAGEKQIHVAGQRIHYFHPDYDFDEPGPYCVPDDAPVSLLELGQIRHSWNATTTICVVLRETAVDWGALLLYERIGLLKFPPRHNDQPVPSPPEEGSVPDRETWPKSTFRIY